MKAKNILEEEKTIRLDEFKHKIDEFRRKTEEQDKLIAKLQAKIEISNYDPIKLSYCELLDDWHVVNKLYTSRDKRLSAGKIIDFASKIYNELKNRGIAINSDKLTELSKELYCIVTNKKYEELGKIELDVGKLDELLDKILIKDFICIVGSVIKPYQNKKPNDLDILIKMPAPSDYLKRAIETRLSKDIGFSDKIHFIWGDPEGPHDTFAPLYDLSITRIKPFKKVMMQAEDTCELVLQETEENMFATDVFKPMKPRKRFYDITEVINYMFKTGNKYALEKKFNGFRALLSKEDNKVSIISDQKRDITKNFKTVSAEATQLSTKNYIIDCEIIYKNAGRSEIAKFITGTGELDDSKIDFYAFDCVFFEKDIANRSWDERKQILHSLNFSKHIKEVHSIIVDSRAEAEKGINFLRNLDGSEGVMIKRYDGIYTKNGETDAWIKFRNEDAIIISVVEVIKKENGYSYMMGIPAANNSNKAYVKDGQLLLGHTFVTSIAAEKGDHLVVSIEEVWRHTYEKDHTFRYSVHKPKVMKTTAEQLTSISRLDELAVSKGEEVIENAEADAKDLDKELEATTTATPGIDKVQGKVIGGIKKKKEKENADRDTEDETRSSASEAFWKDNWVKMAPADGKGKFVYHHHFRGLNEEESKKGEKELIETDHSLHGDLRFEANANELFGFTVFLGAIADNRQKGGDRLVYSSEHKDDIDKLQGSFKLAQPSAWLDLKDGTVSVPKGVGATTNRYAKFFIADKGTYEIGTWREHSVEIFINGDKLKGRMLMQYAPVGEGGRKWLIDFPAEQKPYAETHNKEDIIKELKSKNQKWLIWAKPGEKPEKIEIK